MTHATDRIKVAEVVSLMNERKVWVTAVFTGIACRKVTLMDGALRVMVEKSSLKAD